VRAYMERMYTRPNAPLRIAEAFASIRGSAARSDEVSAPRPQQ
jgi:hypothetical protein